MIKIPTMKAVKSTNLAEIGHEGQGLFVRFLRNDGEHGALYHFPTAGADVHSELIAAKSPGQYFLKHIKGAHVGERVDEAQ